MELSFNQDNFYKNEEEQISGLKNQHNGHKKLVRKIKLVELQLLEDASNIRRSGTEKIEDEKLVN